MKFLNNLNMSQNEIQNAVIQNLADAPSNPRAGQLYWDTTDNKLYIYDGTKWGATGGDDKMDKVNPTGTGYFSLNRKDGTPVGDYSFAEGYNTTSSGYASHAEGYNTTSSGYASHAEGHNTTSSAYASHAEGDGTTASKLGSHAEGYHTTASGDGSHAEGSYTTASGDYSHVEGSNTTASGYYSHAEGVGTIANHAFQHVFGGYNVADPSTTILAAKGTYIEIIGNGESINSRSNARTLDWSGNEILAGTSTATEFIHSGTGETLLSVLNTDGTTDYMLSYKDSTLEVGNLGKAVKLLGNATRPKYETSTTTEGGVDLALYSDTTNKLTASNIKAGANINVTSSGNDVTIKAVDVATLGTDGKVPLSQLPDAVLGQLVYGGNVTTNAVATLTDNAKKKLGTTSATITLTNNTTAITGYKANEGIYYIATTGFTFAGITFESGDWLISTGSAWTKIDTSDAVTGVKGDKETNYRRGNVNITPANIGAEPSDSTRLLTALSSDVNIWELSGATSYIVTANSIVLTYNTYGSTKTYTLMKGTILTAVRNSTDTWPSVVFATGGNAATVDGMIVFTWAGKGDTGWWYKLRTYNYGLALNGSITNGDKVPFYAPTTDPSDSGIRYPIAGYDTTSSTPKVTWVNIFDILKLGTRLSVTATNPALTASGGVCTWAVSHSLWTEDVVVSVYEVSTKEQVLANVVVNSESKVTISIASTSDIAAGTYKVVILGVAASIAGSS